MEPERWYHVNEQECLALVWAIRRYRPLLQGTHFILKADSKAELLRWTLILQEYNFELVYYPSKEDELPDVIRRSDR